MNSSRKIILILFLLTYLGSRVSAIHACLRNIYKDFGYGGVSPNNAREVWPMRAFVKLDIKDMETEHGQGFFDHMHRMMVDKEDMQLPGQFCEINARGQNEIPICIEALKEKFLVSNIKLDILKDTYWRSKETDFISLNPDGSMRYLNESNLITINKNGLVKVSLLMYNNLDGSRNYKYMYFYHLSQHFKYIQSERSFPYTPKEYCQIDKRIKKKKRRNISIDSFHENGEGSMSASSSQVLFQE